MREIVLDTETTGLSHASGHRIVEIGCVELINHIPTPRFFHSYINPERDVSKASTDITGLTGTFLKDYPVFSKVADDFLNFIGSDTLVIHNARFDIGFLNAELDRLQKTRLSFDRVVDTLDLSRRLFPGASASLDALCKRFRIDLKDRTKHGALLDARLLAEVYLELRGGRQRSLGSYEQKNTSTNPNKKGVPIIHFPQRHYTPSEEDKALHKEFLKTIKNPLWNTA